jgi:hypothetical protein
MWTLQRDLLVSFGVPFIFHDTSRDNLISPEKPAELSPLLFLMSQPVKRFAVSSEGHCILEFTSGLELRASPHEKYEAWQSVGTGNLETASFFCDIGGGSPWG